jgi:hypothetical protein
MKPAYRIPIGLIVVIALIGGILGVVHHRSVQPKVPHDYVMPNDNFDQQTMNAIRSYLAQYNVANTPQDHEVYMVTGGLGIANPRIVEWDSGGNMDFGGNQSSDPIYNFQFTSQSPATWKTDYQQQGEMKPVPWILMHTKSGTPYYEWDMTRNQTIQFYFKKDNTYVVLRVDYWLNSSKPTFPEGLLSHLVPVGNPVTKQRK